MAYMRPVPSLCPFHSKKGEVLAPETNTQENRSLNSHALEKNPEDAERKREEEEETMPGERTAHPTARGWCCYQSPLGRLRRLVAHPSVSQTLPMLKVSTWRRKACTQIRHTKSVMPLNAHVSLPLMTECMYATHLASEVSVQAGIDVARSPFVWSVLSHADKEPPLSRSVCDHDKHEASQRGTSEWRYAGTAQSEERQTEDGKVSGRTR